MRDAAAAAAMGLEAGQVCVMLHTGSRGIGHQTCTDHLKVIDRLSPALGIRVPDRQLSCLPVERPEGGLPGGDARRRQLRPGQPACARRRGPPGLRRGAGPVGPDLGMDLVYDVSHNLAKLEEHEVDGRRRTLCVHRKGPPGRSAPATPSCPAATGSWPAGHQPGQHGHVLVRAGRRQAGRGAVVLLDLPRGRAVDEPDQGQEAHVRSRPAPQAGGRGPGPGRRNWKLLSEEAPYAYKDATAVVETCEQVGLSQVVAASARPGS